MRTSLKRSIATALPSGIALLAAVALAAPAQAGGGAESSVAIVGHGVDNGRYVFRGNVESPRSACVPDRKVVVIGYDESQIHSDEVLGRDLTGKNGNFRITVPAPLDKDVAYAELRPSKRENGSVRCRPDVSEAVEVRS